MPPTVSVEVIHNPVPLRILNALPEVKTEGDRCHRKPKLLYAGGKQIHKGWLEFEEVLSLSSSLSHGFDIVICGPGLDGYDAGVEVKNLGMLDQAAFMATLAASDVVVIPSHMEGFPLLALESMALGKLLVSTQVGGLKELIDNTNALPIAVTNPQSLNTALSEALGLFEVENVQLLEAKLACARATASRFFPDRINHDLAKLYRRYI